MTSSCLTSEHCLVSPVEQTFSVLLPAFQDPAAVLTCHRLTISFNEVLDFELHRWYLSRWADNSCLYGVATSGIHTRRSTVRKDGAFFVSNNIWRWALLTMG
jgi:hypothetical protein